MATSLQAPRDYVRGHELDPEAGWGERGGTYGSQRNVQRASSSRIPDDSGFPDRQMAQTATSHACPHQGMVVYWKSKYEQAQREISALRVCIAPFMQWLLLRIVCSSARH